MKSRKSLATLPHAFPSGPPACLTPPHRADPHVASGAGTLPEAVLGSGGLTAQSS